MYTKYADPKLVINHIPKIQGGLYQNFQDLRYSMAHRIEVQDYIGNPSF